MMILIVSAVTFALLGFAGGDALTQLRDNPQISGRDDRAPSQRLRPRSTTSDTVLSVAFRRGHRGLGRVDVLSCAGKRPRMGAFGKYISARDRRLCNRTHVCRAAKPHRRAIQFNDDCRIHRLVDPCDSLDAADRPRARRARDIRPIDCVRHGQVFGSSVLAGGVGPVGAADFGFLAQFHGELQRTMRGFHKLARAKGLSESAVILRHAVRPHSIRS